MKAKLTLKLIAVGCLLSGICFSAFAAGPVEYFDVNGAAAGFGSPSVIGLYDLAGTTITANDREALYYNTANGFSALQFNQANNNTGNGYQALYHNVSGGNNMANGHQYRPHWQQPDAGVHCRHQSPSTGRMS
jgi:hypothetical protein